MANDFGWGWYGPNTTTTTSDQNQPSPDPAGTQQFNNQGAFLSNLATLLGPQAANGGNSPTQNPLGNLFQTMFGNRRRRGGGNQQGWNGWQQRMGGGGMAGDPSGGSDWQAQMRAAFQAANGGYTGWGPVGSAAPGFSVNNNLQWNEPLRDHGTMAPPGAPRFADAGGMVYANGYNPMTGYFETGTRRPVTNTQQLFDEKNWATIPWQGSWADPNSSNFYMTAQNLGPTPAGYFNSGPQGGGYGPPPQGGGYGSPPGGAQGPPPGGAQGPPPAGGYGTPPGANGATGPAVPPTDMIGGTQMIPGYGYGAAPGANAGNNWVPPGGNFNMYQGMPYAGGMGPYSGWLPPAPGTVTDFGGSGQPSSPQGFVHDAAGNEIMPPYATPNFNLPNQYPITSGPNFAPAGGGGQSNLGMPNAASSPQNNYAPGGWNAPSTAPAAPANPYPNASQYNTGTFDWGNNPWG